jgi:hypothetical protein
MVRVGVRVRVRVRLERPLRFALLTPLQMKVRYLYVKRQRLYL